MGCGVAAVATLSSSKPDILTIAFGWGIGVMISGWVAAPVSGNKNKNKIKIPSKLLIYCN